MSPWENSSFRYSRFMSVKRLKIFFSAVKCKMCLNFTYVQKIYILKIGLKELTYYILTIYSRIARFDWLTHPPFLRWISQQRCFGADAQSFIQINFTCFEFHNVSNWINYMSIFTILRQPVAISSVPVSLILIKVTDDYFIFYIQMRNRSLVKQMMWLEWK